MKFLITLIICSAVANNCAPGVELPKKFDNMYDCLQYGFAESSRRLALINKKDVNKYYMHIKFYCTPVTET